jgi:predicted Zn-dependent protease
VSSSDEGQNTMPLGRRLAWLREKLDGLLEKGEVCDDWQALSAEEHRLEEVVISRNLMGVELERQGDMEAAIALYEESVEDEVDSPHPYSRLAVIYHERGWADEEKRVLDKALSVFGAAEPWRDQLAKVRKRQEGEDL